MTVTRSDLESHIARVKREVVDPRAGIYGPESFSWRLDKESIVFLGGGKAALLQLAHPFVAHAIDQHSKTRSDPLGRFQRTFENVFAIVFGDWDSAERSARRVHAIHSRIVGEISEDVGAFRKGDRYDANDERALLWVHATLLHSAVEVYELVLGPLSATDKAGYYEESKRFARLFGISDDVLPQSWDAFSDYFSGMLESDEIHVGKPAREIAAFLFAAPRRGLTPLFHWLRSVTSGLMPPRLRQEFGLPWDRSDQHIYRASVTTLRHTYKRLPKRLRYLPAYVRAQRRIRGIDAPDRLGELLERIATSPLRT
ncbi:MAG: oxygenase MpaB family protein [Polyangiaceae bacterium]